MFRNTALKVIFASALAVVDPAAAGAPGTNGGMRKDVRGGKEGDEADVHAIIRKLQEEVSQLKARLLDTATETPVGGEETGENDPFAALDLCETAGLLHGINARTGKADLSDHTHDIDLLHKHSTSQIDHDHPIDVNHTHNLHLPEIECTCTYEYDEKETTEIQTETWVGPSSTGGGQANINIDDALVEAQTTGPANEDLTHDHDLNNLLAGLDAAGKELSYAAHSFGSSACPEPVDFPRHSTCDNPSTCGSFTQCNDGGNCGDNGLCFTGFSGEGICQRGVPCRNLTACPDGQSDCASDELCTLDTCCGASDVCIPSIAFCYDVGVVGLFDDMKDGEMTTMGIYHAPEN